MHELPRAPESSFDGFDVVGFALAGGATCGERSQLFALALRAAQGGSARVPLVEMLLPDGRGSPENSLPWVPTLARSPGHPSSSLPIAKLKLCSCSCRVCTPGARATGPRIGGIGIGAHIYIEFCSRSGRDAYQCSAVGGTDLLGMRQRT